MNRFASIQRQKIDSFYIFGVFCIFSEGTQYSPSRIPLGHYKYRGSLKSIAAKNFDAKKVSQSEAKEAERMR